MAERIPNFDLSVANKIEAPDLSEIEDYLNGKISGQPEAVKFWAQTLHRILSKSPKLRNGPLAVITEIGPSGVGKTEIVKEAAQYLSGKERPSSFMRVDCGEFQQEHEVAKVLGAPPGYRGSDITPRLAQSEIEKEGIQLKDGRKITILLLDEIEKANPKLSVALLGALDYGKLTLGDNSTADLSDCIVVFTSNLGNQEIKAADSNGTKLTKEEKTKMRMDAMSKHFTPEQLSRMGGESGTLIFEELPREVMANILLSKLTSLEAKYAQQGVNVKIVISNSGAEKLLDLGHSTSEGARRMEHTIEQEVVAKLSGAADRINNMTVMIDADETGIVLYGSKPSGEITKVEAEAVMPQTSTLETQKAVAEPQKDAEYKLPTLIETIEMQKYPFAVFRKYKDYIARLGALIYAHEISRDDHYRSDSDYSFYLQNEILEKTRKGELPDHFFLNFKMATAGKRSGTTEKFGYEIMHALFRKMGQLLNEAIKERDKKKSEKTKHIDSLLAGALQDHPEALVSFFKETFKSDLKKYDEWV